MLITRKLYSTLMLGFNQLRVVFYFVVFREQLLGEREVHFGLRGVLLLQCNDTSGSIE